MQNCHCGSGKPYADCCGAIISGAEVAKTAEALMRSRFSAYVVAEIDYLGDTLHPDHRQDWDKAATEKWAAESEWQTLEILSIEAGGKNDDQGIVEFSATFKENGALKRHHESSRFAKLDGRWYYVDGETPKPQTQRNDGPKVGRNDPCPCGSGKKYKKCCGR